MYKRLRFANKEYTLKEFADEITNGDINSAENIIQNRINSGSAEWLPVPNLSSQESSIPSIQNHDSGLNYVKKITNEFLKSIDHPTTDFQPNGYYLITDDKTIKIFLYPQKDYLNLGIIPLNRKYKIIKDINIDFPCLTLGFSFIKYQPHKTNSELMYWIPIGQLNIKAINTVIDYFINNIEAIFERCEDK